MGRTARVSIQALWATPRTVSTAFERMMIERGDRVVLDEPWSRAYYFGPDQRSDRYPMAFPESTYANVTAAVLELGRQQDVFLKDMAYQALPGLAAEALQSMTHSFLIREPAGALCSLHRHWPDATADEAGYIAQRELFDMVCDVTGVTPAVIDSRDLCADPSRIVEQWCARVGIEHLPHSLRWQPGLRSEWQLWGDWYENVSRSTGFAPMAVAEPDVPDPVRTMLAAATDSYEHLRAHALS